MGSLIMSVLTKWLTYAVRYIFGKSIIIVIISSLVTGLYSLFWPILSELIPNWLSDEYIASFISRVPSEMYWFLYVGALDFGLPLILSAYISRFMIRRLPIFG